MRFDSSACDDLADLPANSNLRARRDAPQVVAQLRRVEKLLHQDPAAASFAYARSGLASPQREAVTNALEALNPPFGWWLRPALRAPGVHGRLIPAWAPLDAVCAMRVNSAVSA